MKDRDSHLVLEASWTPLLDGQLEKKSRIWPGAVKCAEGGLGRVTYVLGQTLSVPKSMAQSA